MAILIDFGFFLIDKWASDVKTRLSCVKMKSNSGITEVLHLRCHDLSLERMLQ